MFKPVIGLKGRSLRVSEPLPGKRVVIPWPLIRVELVCRLCLNGEANQKRPLTGRGLSQGRVFRVTLL